MKRVFLDSSVFFSACYSASGHSRDLLLMALRDEILLVCSNYVIQETRRNLDKLSSDHLVFLDFILDNLPLELIKPTKAEVLAAAEHIALKDAPIVAAAKRGKVDFLVTLDKKHLLDNPNVQNYSGIDIVTPKRMLSQLTGK
jgi:predicted nucleic acid-binding protein